MFEQTLVRLPVDSVEPSKSLLLDALSATPTNGGRMPPTANPLSAARVACVTQRVNAMASDQL